MLFKSAMLVAISLIVVTLAFGVLKHSRSNQDAAKAAEQKNAKGHYPVADYLASEPVDAKKRALRQIRGGRHSRGKQAIKEAPLGIEELPQNSHWWWGLSALPAGKSDAVIVGEVTEAQAFLSNDKTAVYSEFTVRIDETLKSSNALPAPGETIVAERSGGAVRFPSGRVQYYSLDQQGIPLVGNRYVFFLRRNEAGDDFSIITAYELRAGRVLPLDGAGDGKNTRLPFHEYSGCEETKFIDRVRDAVAHSVQALTEEGALRW